MRIASGEHDGRELFGVVVDDTLHDLTDAFSSALDLLSASLDDTGKTQIATAVDRSPTVDLGELRLLPPLLHPGRIFCVGTNYADHVTESDRVQRATDHPMIFTRFPASLVGHGAPIVRPQVSSNFDYEGELAVVIGRPTFRIEPTDALDAIAGYSCLMDGTLRDYQRHTSQFTPGKNFDRSGAWGPWITTADEVGDPYNLHLRTVVSGQEMQAASTTQLIFNIESIVSYCSTFTTLQPGDVIATGTPGGVGYARKPPRWLEPGDEVTVDIPGVGRLSNPVVDEPTGR